MFISCVYPGEVNTVIKFPVRVQADPGSTFAHIRDAANKVVAGGLIPIEAEQLVAAANAGAAPRSRSRKQKIEEQLKASDLGAQLTGRTDIEYGHHETLPRGEHVARLGKTSRSGE